MIAIQIKPSPYCKKRPNSAYKNYETGKITIFTYKKAELTLDQAAKLVKFLETL